MILPLVDVGLDGRQSSNYSVRIASFGCGKISGVRTYRTRSRIAIKAYYNKTLAFGKGFEKHYCLENMDLDWRIRSDLVTQELAAFFLPAFLR